MPHVFRGVQHACPGKPGIVLGQVGSGVPGVVVKQIPIESRPHPFVSPAGQHAGNETMPGIS
jgi:hypothetical protein